MGDIVDSGIGFPYRPASLCSLAGRYDNPMPESIVCPQSGTMNLATGLKRFGKVEICGGQKFLVGIRMRIRKYLAEDSLNLLLESSYICSNTRLAHQCAVYLFKSKLVNGFFSGLEYAIIFPTLWEYLRQLGVQPSQTFWLGNYAIIFPTLWEYLRQLGVQPSQTFWLGK
jgi:hypothetical protein